MDRDAKLAELKTALDSVRPFAGDALVEADRYFDVFITYTSNAIEGSTLTHGETGILIEKGITVGGKSIKDHLAALDHHAAMGFIRVVARSERPLNESVVCNLHRQVVLRDTSVMGGRYATSMRMAAGTGVIYPNTAKVPILMKSFGEALEKAEAGPDSALNAHLQIASIHPFSDGNGRTARLLMNMVLLRAGFAPLSVGPEHRSQYIDVLAKVQKTGAIEAYTEFMKDRLIETMSQYVAVVARGKI